MSTLNSLTPQFYLNLITNWIFFLSVKIFFYLPSFHLCLKADGKQMKKGPIWLLLRFFDLPMVRFDNFVKYAKMWLFSDSDSPYKVWIGEKYAGLRVFSDPYFPVWRKNQRFCPYTGNTGQWKPVFWHILCKGYLRVCSIFPKIFW